MTIKEYIVSKMEAFGEISEAYFADIAATGLDLGAEYTTEVSTTTNKAIIGLIEELILAPKVSEVGDTGSKLVFEYGELSKYYIYLCRKYGVEANKDVLELLGVNAIIDRSNIW